MLSFPPTSLEWEKLIPLLGPTHAAIARYDGVLSSVPNADVLLAPLTINEAVLSSRIEGTQATMGEVLEYEATGDTGKYDESRKADINEVLNYRKAMREAEKRCRSPNGLCAASMPCCFPASVGRTRCRANSARCRTGSARTAALLMTPTLCPSVPTSCLMAWMPGNASSMRSFRTSLCNWPCCMWSLRPCIPSWTAMVAWGVCLCRFSCGRKVVSRDRHSLSAPYLNGTATHSTTIYAMCPQRGRGRNGACSFWNPSTIRQMKISIRQRGYLHSTTK